MTPLKQLGKLVDVVSVQVHRLLVCAFFVIIGSCRCLGFVAGLVYDDFRFSGRDLLGWARRSGYRPSDRQASMGRRLGSSWCLGSWGYGRGLGYI